MPTAIAMPKLGIKMEEGTVLEWRAAIGDRVEKGQIILLIESDKAETEIEAPASGVLRHVYIEPDETVPCGTFLAALTDASDQDFDADAFRSAEESVSELRAPARGAAAPRSETPERAAAAPREGAPSTPAARKRARELDVDLATVPGTGPGGRVTREDVEAFAEQMALRVLVRPGLRLDVASEGEGDTVLLLPGFGSDTSAFARLAPALAESYRVRGVNPRGVGVSDAPEDERYDPAEAAADAAALLEAPGHVIGASLGAAAALELALAHPDRVRSLVLITPFVGASPRLLAVIDAWCAVAAQAGADALARMLLPWLFSPATLADARAAKRARRGLAETSARVPVATLLRSAAGLRAWSGTRTDTLAKISAPTLVIGAAADLLAPDAEPIARAIPNATCVMIPDAAHAVAIEAPDPVTTALRTHLR